MFQKMFQKMFFVGLHSENLKVTFIYALLTTSFIRGKCLHEALANSTAKATGKEFNKF